MPQTPLTSLPSRAAFETAAEMFDDLEIGDMSQKEQHLFVKMLYPEFQATGDVIATPLCEPISEPQCMALETLADEVYFGGRAGCGKSYLLLMAAIFRA